MSADQTIDWIIEAQFDTLCDALIDTCLDSDIPLEDMGEQLRADYSTDVWCWFNDRRVERGIA